MNTFSPLSIRSSPLRSARKRMPDGGSPGGNRLSEPELGSVIAISAHNVPMAGCSMVFFPALAAQLGVIKGRVKCDLADTDVGGSEQGRGAHRVVPCSSLRVSTQRIAGRHAAVLEQHSTECAVAPADDSSTARGFGRLHRKARGIARHQQQQRIARRAHRDGKEFRNRRIRHRGHFTVDDPVAAAMFSSRDLQHLIPDTR